jgi:predicted AlkP superfamily pyrophosphatase or phosphodiesterase
MQKLNMFKFIRGFLILTCFTGACRTANAAPADANSDHVVVMISVDGLAAYYLDDPKADMPTLRKLAAEGARAKSMKASTPTVTWPNHTTLVTGDNPARHGVVGNNYFDRATGEKVTLISDPVFDKDQIVKVPTIYDAAKAAGMKTAAIRWPATRNAKTLDWTLPDVRLEEQLEKYTTPALLEECKAANIHLIKDDPTAKFNADISRDEVYTRAFDLILHENHPQLALLHVIDVDHTEHLKGPRSEGAYQAVHEADGYVREVWDELQKDYPGRATLIVVSDHGFSPIERMLLPNVLLLKAGLIDSDKKNAGGEIHLVTQGGSALIYVRDEANRKEVMARVRKALKGLKGISKIVGLEDFKKYGVANPKDDPHAPDMILFADEGCTFGDTAAGALPFNEKPERKGSHGHDSALPDLHATFIAWGVGIKPGVKLGEISNLDVAPTIAKLLGLDLPNTDGKPLTAVLAK